MAIRSKFHTSLSFPITMLIQNFVSPFSTFEQFFFHNSNYLTATTLPPGLPVKRIIIQMVSRMKDKRKWEVKHQTNVFLKKKPSPTITNASLGWFHHIYHGTFPSRFLPMEVQLWDAYNLNSPKWKIHHRDIFIYHIDAKIALIGWKILVVVAGCQLGLR